MDILFDAIRVGVIFGAAMSVVPMLVLLERRVAAFIQNRVGPNRVGPQGLFQPLADVLKLLFKEDLYPRNVDRVLYILGPVLAFVPVALSFAAMPVARMPHSAVASVQIADISVGVLFVLAITSLGVYGISFGGWASNNKYALLGGIRSSAQIISYEIAMGLAIVSVVMLSRDIHLGRIVESQIGIANWNVWYQPLAFVVFLVASLAENNRLPFDLAECESELVGGFHTEYSSMKFAMYFLGEYFAMVVMSSLLVTLFLGGWDPGFFTLPEGWLGTALSALVFMLKLGAILFLFIQVRWTLPRFRYDQLMRLGWKGLIPLALANVVVTGVVLALRAGGDSP